ncbi:DNA starvation/stationary phase protection protein [Candidatus Gracilibacteria bacterium]|nr:DNA starvation/stationary phase protection protein [Candidatus Gracilibacteria bacterium]
MNIGLDESTRMQMAEALKKLLGTSYTLYVKTQNFHWNVEGKLFMALHKAFEEQYEALIEHNDSIAERIRMLGFRAPGSMKEFLATSEVKETQDVPGEDKMLEILLADDETFIRQLRSVIELAAEKGDEATNDVLIPILSSFEKRCWMWRSYFA